jgi:hypothetical protein
LNWKRVAVGLAIYYFILLVGVVSDSGAYDCPDEGC